MHVAAVDHSVPQTGYRLLGQDVRLGRLVVELYNATNLPVRLYAEEGFVQILFFESDEECETSYADRQGKYQDQSGLTLPKL